MKVYLVTGTVDETYQGVYFEYKNALAAAINYIERNTSMDNSEIKNLIKTQGYIDGYVYITELTIGKMVSTDFYTNHIGDE